MGAYVFGYKYNSPGDSAGELSKPSTDSASLPLEIEKTLFVFGGGFSGGDVTVRVCFGNFGHLRAALVPNSLTHSSDSKFC